MVDEWSDPSRVAEYLAREIPHRSVAEEMLLDSLPSEVKRCLDLGTGDGRLISLVQTRHPDAVCVGLDSSTPMLDRARSRLGGGGFVELHSGDLTESISHLGRFDAVVSALAIHHLEDERKRSLFSEVHDMLDAGGVFVNLDLVSSATEALHERFRTAIGRPQDDPTDRLSGLCEQLQWLSEAGFGEVDCHFKWLELSLLIARRER